jgi:eukaryotic-like serine/threonine-protein kinase
MELPVKIGEIVAKKYRIDRSIGAGGMGVVVAAFHLELEQPVAIKFLNGDAAAREDANERFRREARAAARIRSEHVARVLDIELLDERIPYMVMELLEGNDLERELEQAGPLPTAVAVDYLLQAIDAVAEAHANGIVHRDLKPTNLFLARRPDGSRIVKVLDFGISKLVGSGSGRGAALTRSASMFGSPLYMSPEQMRSARDVDARSDIWSLGAILYELIAGRPPFNGDSMPALCVAILNDTPQPLQTFVPGVPPAIDEVLARCLARDVTARFQSVADLADALAPFSPGGYFYAERARRTLAQASLGSTTRLGSDAPVATPYRPSTPAAAPGVGAALRADPTQAGWDKPGGRVTVTRRIGTIAAALVLLLGVGVLVRSLLTPAELQRAQASLPVAAAPAAPTVMAEPAVPPAEPVSPPTPPPSESTAAPSSAAPATEPRAPAVQRPSKPASAAAATAAPAPAKPRPPAREAGTGGRASLTDFGGRIY